MTLAFIFLGSLAGLIGVRSERHRFVIEQTAYACWLSLTGLARIARMTARAVIR